MNERVSKSMDPLVAEQLYLNFVSRLGNAFLALLGLSAIFIAIFVQSRFNRLSAILSEISSLPFGRKESIANEIHSKISQYARAYDIPKGVCAVILGLFSLGCLASLSTWVVYIMALGDAVFRSPWHALPLVFGFLFLVVLILAVLAIVSPALEWFGVDLPSVERIGELPVLARITGAGPALLLKQAGLSVVGGQSPCLFLLQRHLWIYGFRYLFCIFEGTEHAPKGPEEVLLISCGGATEVRSGPRFEGAKLASMGPRQLMEISRFNFDVLPKLERSRGLLYVCYDGQEHPLFAELSFTKVGDWYTGHPEELVFVTDRTCSLKDREGLRARHPILELFLDKMRKEDDFVTYPYMLPAGMRLKWSDLLG